MRTQCQLGPGVQACADFISVPNKCSRSLSIIPARCELVCPRPGGNLPAPCRSTDEERAEGWCLPKAAPILWGEGRARGTRLSKLFLSRPHSSNEASNSSVQMSQEGKPGVHAS